MPPLSIHPLEDFTQFVRPPARLAALDVGTKTIGIATCTPDWQIATPMTTITRTKWSNDLAALHKALDGFGVGGLIVGLPYLPDGSLGPRAQGVKQVVFNLIKAEPNWLTGPIAFIDESMSTAAAAEYINHHKNMKKAKNTGALDAMAASVILERALVHLRQQL